MLSSEQGGSSTRALVWGGLTAEEVKRQYDMREAVPDGQEFVERCLARSKPLRASLPGPRDVRYGRGPRQILDVYPAQHSGAPVVLFFHGGAWRYQSKEHFAFMAPPLLQAGITLVLASYDLHPAASIREMMQEAREAVVWTYRELGARGGLVVSGHSAGAQLLGMALAYDFRTDGGPKSPFKGAHLISGSYDMEPHRHHERYADMGLDEVTVKAISPAMNPPLDTDMPVVLVAGAQETPGYLRQAEEFASKLRSRGHPVRVLLSPGDHHFSVVDRLGEPDHPVMQALIELCEGATAA